MVSVGDLIWPCDLIRTCIGCDKVTPVGDIDCIFFSARARVFWPHDIAIIYAIYNLPTHTSAIVKK